MIGETVAERFLSDKDLGTHEGLAALSAELTESAEMLKHGISAVRGLADRLALEEKGQMRLDGIPSANPSDALASVLATLNVEVLPGGALPTAVTSTSLTAFAKTLSAVRKGFFEACKQVDAEARRLALAEQPQLFDEME
jgi:hypothetical protein